MSGKVPSIIFGITFFTFPITSLSNLFLNCSEVTYLYVKKPPPMIPKVKTVDTIER